MVSALEAAWQATQRAHGAQDDRLQGAYALKAGYHFYDAFTKDAGSQLVQIAQGNITTATPGVSLELSLGTSGSTSVNTLHDVTYRGANLDAGGDLTVIARQGENTGTLDIMGSSLAGYNQTLSAGKNLSVRYAPQTRVSTEKSSNHSASIGVGVGTGGLYFTAAGQIGKASGEALKEDNAESRLIADHTLTLLSGGDASLKGAIATAHRIEADIAGKLTLSSLQDSERYQYKSSNAGGSLTISQAAPPAASLTGGTQTLNNRFQSVVEQTGLFAGEGGFNLKAGGHTQLNGAAIASSATPDKNRLSTHTLDFIDLTNFEQTQTGGYTFGLSTAPGGTFVTPVPNLSVSRQSLTQSVLSPATVDIRDAAAQTALTAARAPALVTALNAHKANLASQLTGIGAQKTQLGRALNAWFNWQDWDSGQNIVYNTVTGAWLDIGWHADSAVWIAQKRQEQQGALNALTAQETALASQLAQINSQIGQAVQTSSFLIPAALQGRNLATANPALANTFNKDKTRAQLEAMSVFAETAMRIVGDVYQKYDKAESDAERALRRARGTSGEAAAQSALDAARAAKKAIETERALAHGLVGALTAAIGGTSPVNGFIGGTAGKLATTELDRLLADSNWAKTNPIASNLLKTLTATAVGSITGGTTGGFVASNGDRFNRQLHPDEKARIRQLAGTDKEKALRLAAAACYMVKCSAEFVPGTVAYNEARALEKLGITYTAEQALLRSQYDGSTQLFSYGFFERKWDDIKRFDNTYGISTRALGTGQVIGGSAASVAGSIVAATGAAACAPSAGAGCAAAAGGTALTLWGADQIVAGSRTVASGQPQYTLGAQFIADLTGISVDTAELLYSIPGLAAGGAGVAVGTVHTAKIASDFNKVRWNFGTGGASAADTALQMRALGIAPTAEVMASPQAKALIAEIRAANPGMTKQAVEEEAMRFIVTGTAIPVMQTVQSGTALVKIVPRGAPNPTYSGYWMSVDQARAMANLTPQQAASALGVPANTANQWANGMDFYAITAKSGQTPTVFVSTVARTNQGMSGGAVQTIVPNRQLWTDAVRIDIRSF